MSGPEERAFGGASAAAGYAEELSNPSMRGTALGDSGPRPSRPTVWDSIPEHKLWIWRNGDHFLAYAHEFPCLPCGDPCTIGQPAGYAILKPSVDGSRSVTVETWHLHYAIQLSGRWTARTFGGTRSEVEMQAHKCHKEPSTRCIRITGPYKQEIPA